MDDLKKDGGDNVAVVIPEAHSKVIHNRRSSTVGGMSINSRRASFFIGDAEGNKMPVKVNN